MIATLAYAFIANYVGLYILALVTPPWCTSSERAERKRSEDTPSLRATGRPLLHRRESVAKQVIRYNNQVVPREGLPVDRQPTF